MSLYHLRHNVRNNSHAHKMSRRNCFVRTHKEMPVKDRLNRKLLPPIIRTMWTSTIKQIVALATKVRGNVPVLKRTQLNWEAVDFEEMRKHLDHNFRTSVDGLGRCY